jgi:outer membrane protein OmpA-like peptidoglycan-associated protein
METGTRVYRIAAILGLAAVWGSPRVAHADPDGRLQLGVFAGANRLGGVELGNSYYQDQAPTDSMVVGGRVRYRLTDRIGLELDGRVAPTATSGDAAADRPGIAAPTVGIGLQGTFDFVQWRRLRAYASAGVGADAMWIRAPETYLVERDIDENLHWGAGARFAVGDRWGVRVDARQIMTAGRESQLAFNYEATAGIYVSFGEGAADAPRAAAAIAAADPDAAAARPQRTARAARPQPKRPNPPAPAPSPVPADDDEDDGAGVLASAAQLTTVGADLAVVLPGKSEMSLVAADDRAPVRSAPAYSEPEPEPDKVLETADDVRTALQGIRFKPSRARIRRRYARTLDRVAEYMHAHPHARITIAGYADESGTDRGNLMLSRTRADRVKWYLVDKGIGDERVRTWGYGTDNPIASNLTPDGRSANRRIEVYFAE